MDDAGEIFVGDVHQDQHIYLADPEPVVPPPTPSRGRPPSVLPPQIPALRVDDWAKQQPPSAWQPVTLRSGAKGSLEVDILHRRVWVWDGREAQARPWHLIVLRRERATPTEIK